VVARPQIGGAPQKTVHALQQAGVALKPITIDADDREHFYQLLNPTACPRRRQRPPTRRG
jgi:hypothetical protein